MASSAKSTKKKRTAAVLSKSKHRKIQNEDRISNLPEALLSKILSLLSTEEAMETSILSKRWRFLWTLTKNLKFSDNFMFSDERRKNIHFSQSLQTPAEFCDHVNRILLLVDSRDVDKFSLSLSVYSDIFHINKWISDAVARNVKDLNLNLHVLLFKHPVELPSSLFYSKTLEVLKLNMGIVFNIPKSAGYVCFPSLKVLHLEYVVYGEIPGPEYSTCFPVLKILKLVRVDENGSVNKLIRICPILEDLFIETDEGNPKIDIFAPALKHCQIHLDFNVRGCQIRIDAPVLQYLAITGLYLSDNLFIKESDSLIVAELKNIEYDYDLNAEGANEYKLMKVVDKVQHLSVLGYTFEYLIARVPILPVFCNLISLELDLSCYKLNLLQRFLENSNKLLRLVVKMHPVSQEHIHDDESRQVDQKWWPELARVPKCLLSTLIKVEVSDVNGCTNQVAMIENILKNARRLEKMTVKTCNITLEASHQILEKISSVPRGSRECKVWYS